MRSLTASEIPMSRRMGGLNELFPRGSHAAQLLDHAMPCGVSIAMALGRNILVLTKASAKLSHLMFEWARSQLLACAILQGGQACSPVNVSG